MSISPSSSIFICWSSTILPIRYDILYTFNSPSPVTSPSSLSEPCKLIVPSFEMFLKVVVPDDVIVASSLFVVSDRNAVVPEVSVVV